jgi:phosphatidylinositol-3-phosphatase
VRRGGRLCIAVVTLVLAAGCTSGSQSSESRSTAAAPAPATSALPTEARRAPRPAHVMVAIFENEDAARVMRSAKAPYLTQLAESAAALDDAHGETHPSEPNYLALFSGSTHGVQGDPCPVDLTGDNLAAQLIAAGMTFTGYSEDLPQPGYTGCSSGRYARKHNPWVNFRDLPASVNQPFSALPSDYANLPTVSFVVPNLCNDMHDCGVAAGDAWAKEHLAPYVRWATANNSLLIVTFDEDRGSRANHIATIVAGAGVAKTHSSQRVDHYDLLRTIEDMYGLPPIGKAATATALTGIWKAS